MQGRWFDVMNPTLNYEIRNYQYHASGETCSSGFVLKVLTVLDTSSPLHSDRTRDSTHIPLWRTPVEGHAPFLFTAVGALRGSVSNKHPCIYSPCLEILTIQVPVPTLIQPTGVAISFRPHGGTYPQHFLEMVTFLTGPTRYFTQLTTLGYTCCYSTSDLSQRHGYTPAFRLQITATTLIAHFSIQTVRRVFV